MLNRAQIIGRLGNPVELRYTQNGSPIGNMSVATDESYIDRDGNKVERTEWHKVMLFGKQAENCANYLTKGSLVYVEGSLQTRKWQDQNGQDRYTTEIKAQRVQFLDRKGADDGQQGGGQQQRQQRQQRQQVRQGGGQAQPYEDLGPKFPDPSDEDNSVPF